MSIPPVFPASFYKALVEGAKLLGVSRVRFATDAVRHYFKAVEKKRSTGALAKALDSEELTKSYKAANSRIAKEWWSTVSEKERKERALKAIQARWSKGRKKPGPKKQSE